MQEKGAADHRRRWSSLRLYLCGDEMNAAAPDDDDDETLSVKSFETCVMMPQEVHAVPVADQQSDDVHDADDNTGEPEDQRISGHVAVPPTEPAEKEGAATLIQSAFRGFMVPS